MAKKQQAAAAPAPTVVPVVPPQGASLTTAVLQAHGYIVLFVALFFLGESVGFSVSKIGEEREECSEGFFTSTLPFYIIYSHLVSGPLSRGSCS